MLTCKVHTIYHNAFKQCTRSHLSPGQCFLPTDGLYQNTTLAQYWHSLAITSTRQPPHHTPRRTQVHYNAWHDKAAPHTIDSASTSHHTQQMMSILSSHCILLHVALWRLLHSLPRGGSPVTAASHLNTPKAHLPHPGRRHSYTVHPGGLPRRFKGLACVSDTPFLIYIVEAQRYTLCEPF